MNNLYLILNLKALHKLRFKDGRLAVVDGSGPKRKYLEKKLLKKLRRGIEWGYQQTSRICRRILDQGDSLFMFLQDKTVPVTNNLEEQQLQPLAILKKLSFGVQSDRSARFIERIFSITGTFAQQKRNPLLGYKRLCILISVVKQYPLYSLE